MRMYQHQHDHQRYHILPPWENTDSRPVKSIVKTYQKPEYLVRNQDLSAREVKTLLPVLGKGGQLSMEQKKLLKESVGVMLYSSRPEVIQRLTRSLHDADPLDQGKISKGKLVEIFRENNVNVDENTWKLLFRMFDPDKTGKCMYHDIMEFLTDALNEYKIQRDKSEFTNLPRHTQKLKVRHPSMNSSEFILAPIASREIPEDCLMPMPGVYSKIKLNQTFTERRDAGLRLEIERCFQDYKGKGDVYYIFASLKKVLLSREEDMIGQYKLRDIVSRHQLPLNDALIEKMIDRLDPVGSGNVSCEAFVDFLEKSLPLPNGYTGIPGKKDTNKLIVPARPTWETRRPLKAIQGKAVKTETSNEIGSKEFEKFMKLVNALRRHAGDSETLPANDAREIILKYNALYSVGLTKADIDQALVKRNQSGLIEIDSIIDNLGVL